MTRLEQILDRDLFRFSKDPRSKQAIIRVITCLGCDSNHVVKARGSGESLILIFPQYAMKIFPDGHDISYESSVLSSIKSDYLIKGVAYSPTTPVSIIYERVVPVKNILKPDITQLTRILCNIAYGLYDLHRSGYIHGDVAIGNIGRNINGNYVLYDLETAKFTSTDRERFLDVEMFLEDLKIQYKKWSGLQGIVSGILDHLRDNYRTIEIVTVTGIYGKKRRREKYSYRYDINGFVNALSEICN